MNFKYFIYFLYIIHYFNTANSFTDMQLSKMYTSIIGECNETISSDGEETYLGVSYETGKHYFSDVANCTKHGISKGEASQIIDRMWPEPMSREQFKKSIEFKLTYKQLENIYDEVLGTEKINRYVIFIVTSHYVTKNRVKAYLLSQQHQYGLNEKEVKEIIKPLKKLEDYFNILGSFNLFKKSN